LLLSLSPLGSHPPDAAEAQMHQDRGEFISMAPCGTKGTGWKFDKAKGTIESTDTTGTCVGYYNSAAPLTKLKQMVAPVPCDGSRPNWSTEFKVVRAANSSGSLQAVLGNSSLDPFMPAGDAPCLAIVRPNVNVSLGVSAVLKDGVTGQALTALASSSHPASDPRPNSSWSPSDPRCLFPMGKPTDPTGCTDTYRQQVKYQVKKDVEYTLMVAMETTRTAPFTVVNAAPALAQALSLARTSTAADSRRANAEAWAAWWNAR
jgi:hypothetical protein